MADMFSNGKYILGFIFLVCRMSLAKKTPAFFVFGDSLVDPGNNNYITTLARANYPPNGIDFGKPTGRFTNNRTVADILGQNLGSKEFTPPYLAPTTTGPVILKGVNYASGAGGILNESGQIYGGRINLDAQIDNFVNTRQDIISRIGHSAALKLLRKALFSVTMGSNDFINNYLAPVISEYQRTSIPQKKFVGILIARLRLQTTRLYNLGARKMVVVSVGPLGCIPYERGVNLVADPDKCAEFPNQIVESFNSKLRTLVNELNTNLPGARFVYADTYKTVKDIIENHKTYGFENAYLSCCRIAGLYESVLPCGPEPPEICEDRSKYVFWDVYHPSDASNVIIANRLLFGNSSYISPMNIVQLLRSS